MRAYELTEAERPGIISRGLKRIQAKLPGFLGGNRAAGQVDIQRQFKPAKAKFERWMGQGGFEYDNNLTGAAIQRAWGRDAAEAMKEVGIQPNGTVSKKEADDMIWTMLQMKASGRLAHSTESEPSDTDTSTSSRTARDSSDSSTPDVPVAPLDPE